MSSTKKAWELNSESGCDKLSVGDAKISEKHCNFFHKQWKCENRRYRSA